jgi:hypothetical protein
MTAVPAKVVSIDRQGNRYRIVVQMRRIKYRGSFDTLVFGPSANNCGKQRDNVVDGNRALPETF